MQISCLLRPWLLVNVLLTFSVLRLSEGRRIFPLTRSASDGGVTVVAKQSTMLRSARLLHTMLNFGGAARFAPRAAYYFPIPPHSTRGVSIARSRTLVGVEKPTDASGAPIPNADQSSVQATERRTKNIVRTKERLAYSGRKEHLAYMLFCIERRKPLTAELKDSLGAEFGAAAVTATLRAQWEQMGKVDRTRFDALAAKESMAMSGGTDQQRVASIASRKPSESRSQLSERPVAAVLRRKILGFDPAADDDVPLPALSEDDGSDDQLDVLLNPVDEDQFDVSMTSPDSQMTTFPAESMSADASAGSAEVSETPLIDDILRDVGSGSAAAAAKPAAAKPAAAKPGTIAEARQQKLEEARLQKIAEANLPDWRQGLEKIDNKEKTKKENSNEKKDVVAPSPAKSPPRVRRHGERRSDQGRGGGRGGGRKPTLTEVAAELKASGGKKRPSPNPSDPAEIEKRLNRFFDS